MKGVISALPNYLIPAMSRAVGDQRSRWPLLTDRLPVLDTSKIVTTPDGFRISRTDISLWFKPNVSDSSKAVFFERHAIHVLGVTRTGRFFVRIPDPGPTLGDLYRVLEALRREPEIDRVGWIPRDSAPEILHNN